MSIFNNAYRTNCRQLFIWLFCGVDKMSKILWSMLVGFIEGIVIWKCIIYPVLLKKECIELVHFMTVKYGINVGKLMKRPKESYRKYYERLHVLYLQTTICSAF